LFLAVIPAKAGIQLCSLLVIPAKAGFSTAELGIQLLGRLKESWIPASAGMTAKKAAQETSNRNKQ
jgi:hypothetical protein